MNRAKTYFALGLIVAVLVLGVAYAYVANINLTVSGTATATAASDSFDVQFVSGKGVGDGQVSFDGFTETTGGIAAEFAVTGLDEVGDTETVTLTIENKSVSLLADLEFTAATQSGADGYFKITSNLNKEQLAVADNGNASTAEVTVTVELLKLPIEEQEVTAEISAFVKATPVNPSL